MYRNLKKDKMKYTAKQIENAKRNYNSFLRYETAQEQSCFDLNPNEAEIRAEYHNSLVKSILEGNKEEEKKWKLFYLTKEVKSDQKTEESKSKLKANKAASSDILAPIKQLRKLGDFGKWLNNSSNPFRKQHFNKKYTIEAVNEFLSTL